MCVCIYVYIYIYIYTHTHTSLSCVGGAPAVRRPCFHRCSFYHYQLLFLLSIHLLCVFVCVELSRSARCRYPVICCVSLFVIVLLGLALIGCPQGLCFGWGRCRHVRASPEIGGAVAEFAVLQSPVCSLGAKKRGSLAAIHPTGQRHR